MDEHCNEKLSEALKELGYPTKVTFVNHFGAIEIPVNQGYIHLWDAQKWLREEKNIHIEIPIWLTDDGMWKYSFRLQTREFYDRAIGEWDTYEKALSEGIKEAVKILKEEEK